MRPSQVLEMLDREFLSAGSGASTPVMLWGPPGIGKSQIIAGIAGKHGVPLVDVRLSPGGWASTVPRTGGSSLRRGIATAIAE